MEEVVEGVLVVAVATVVAHRMYVLVVLIYQTE